MTQSVGSDVERASWLRGMSLGLSMQDVERPYVIAVGGGKGGVGKSLVSANLAASLAKSGMRVLLVDLDVGGANLHTYFGIGMPSNTLAGVLSGSMRGSEAMIDVGYQGVCLLAGRCEGSNIQTHFLGGDGFDKTWEAVDEACSARSFDVVILDLGAGVHDYTVKFFAASNLGISVVLPEPTSIENAYSFLKSNLRYIIEVGGFQLGCQERASQLQTKLLDGALVNPAQGVDAGLLRLQGDFPDLVPFVIRAIKRRQIGIVANQTRSQRDIEIASSMEIILGRFFGFKAKDLGFLNYDDSAWKTLRNRRLLCRDFPHSLLAKRLAELARKVIDLIALEKRGMPVRNREMSKEYPQDGLSVPGKR